MTTSICRTDCSELGILVDELKRLANAGLVVSPSSNRCDLKPGEFTVDMPLRENSNGGVFVYYRE